MLVQRGRDLGTALSSAEVTTLITASARWPCGARRGVNVLVIGQSNAVNSLSDGAWNLCAQGLAWHLGAASYGVIGNQGSSAYTAIGGHGIYNVRQPPVTGGISRRIPDDGSNPGGWSLGTDGLAVEAYLAEWSAADLADIAAIVWPWFESDSTRQYSEGAFLADRSRRIFSPGFGQLGRTAPRCRWHGGTRSRSGPPGPESNDPQRVCRRRHCSRRRTQSARCLSRPTAIRAARPGTRTPARTAAGDNNHLDATDNLRLGQVAARPRAGGAGVGRRRQHHRDTVRRAERRGRRSRTPIGRATR